MIIVMKKKTGAEEIGRVVGLIRERGLTEHISHGSERTVIGAVGDERVFRANELDNLPGVERVIRILNEWVLISRDERDEDSVIHVRGVAFGGGKMLDIAAEGRNTEQADAVYIDPFYLHMRPYSDGAEAQGRRQIVHMKNSLKRLHEAGKPALVRIRDVRQIEDALAAEADILYLGGELMNNRTLQGEVGRLNTPVVLCKDKHHRVDDWLAAAEHIARRGNPHVILGEAGTLSFEPEHAYRLDVDAIVRVKKAVRLPVIANITRLWHNEMPQGILYKLAAAAGADGIVNSLA